MDRQRKVARELKYYTTPAVLTDFEDRLAVVPELIGWTLDEARRIAPNLVVRPAETTELPAAGVIVDQDPVARRLVWTGSTITVWLGTGPGNAGVREPRRPVPPVREQRAAADLDRA